METLPFILFLLGLLAIIIGSNWFIDATIWIAKALRIPNIIIGATLVSLCTTLPEAMVSTSSSLMGNSNIAFGNAIGSIACNTGFILGLAILLSKPQINDKQEFQRKGGFLILLLCGLVTIGFMSGVLNQFMGFALIGLLIFYLFLNTRQALRSQRDNEEKPERHPANVWLKQLFIFAIGLIFTIKGANLLVENGEKIAVLLGVPDVIIGLTLTAIGTSLPELVTAITAYVKKASDLSLGNLIGANLMNVLLVIGLSSTILPINIDPTFISFHLPFVIMIIFIPLLASNAKKGYFSRLTGLAMMVLYVMYIGINFKFF